MNPALQRGKYPGKKVVALPQRFSVPKAEREIEQILARFPIEFQGHIIARVRANWRDRNGGGAA